MKIKSIKKIETDSLCYDITIPRNHNFFANGILVHNSSATIYCRVNPISTLKEYEVGICTRNMEKKLEQKYVSAYKNIATGVILRKHYAKDIFYGERLEPSSIHGWMDESTNTFYADFDIKNQVAKFEYIQNGVKLQEIK